MRATVRVTLIGALGLGLLGLPGPRLIRNQPAPVARIEAPPASHRCRDAVERRLWEARCWRGRAVIAANREREALEAWDPAWQSGLNAETWRTQWTAADPTGDLRRAMALARQAAAAARKPGEKAGAMELLVLLDHERGEHQAALEQAMRLLAPEPDSERARMVFRVAKRRAALVHPVRPAITTSGARDDRAPASNRL